MPVERGLKENRIARLDDAAAAAGRAVEASQAAAECLAEAGRHLGRIRGHGMVDAELFAGELTRMRYALLGLSGMFARLHREACDMADLAHGVPAED